MKSIIFSLLGILFLLTISAQNTYYVSENGQNSNPGTFAEPWETIQYGLDQLQPGDNLLIMEGMYNEKLQMNESGSEGNFITISNYEEGQVIIDGSGITTQEAVIEIYGQEYIIITGLTIANNEMTDAQGILIENNCSNIAITGNTIYDINFSSNPNAPVNENTNAQPIIVYGTDPNIPITDIEISGNTVYDCMTGYSEVVAVNGNVDGFHVMDNIIYNNTNIGIDLIGHEGTCPDPANDQARNGIIRGNIIYNCLADYATSGGIYVDGARDLIIENNYSYNNGYGIEIGCENIGKSAENIIVRNNVFYNNEVAGIALGGFDYPGGSGMVSNISITNNTLLKNDYSGTYSGELYLTYFEDVEIFNNIFFTTSQNHAIVLDSDFINLLLDYNLFYCLDGASNIEFYWDGDSYTGLTDYQNATGQDQNSIFGDPLFVNDAIPNPNIHLQPNSPAIDAGDPNYSPAANELDIDGNARIYNNTIDIGADEYDGVSAKAFNKFDQQVNIYPNPSAGIIYFDFSGEFDNKVLKAMIYDFKGRCISSMKFRGNTLNLSDLSSGIYCIEVYKDAMVLTRTKILIE